MTRHRAGSAPLARGAATAAAAAGGRLLGGLFGTVTRLRQTTKPLHPRGRVLPAVLTRTGGRVPAGVAWLDEPGRDEVLVRLSAAVGLPAGWPDVQGMALRVATGGHEADILLASTGLGRLSRFVLTPRRGPACAMTTLMPYRGPRGPVVLGARPVGPRDYELLWTGRGGDWTPYGRLTLAAGEGSDLDVSFDPLLHVVPGLDHYRWIRMLREPAYARAREESRRAGPGAGT